MKTRVRKCFSLLLCAALVMSLLCISANAAEGDIVARNQYGDTYTSVADANIL